MQNFYPRSPCGERLRALYWHCRRRAISIHALRVESDGQAGRQVLHHQSISIHALRVESDRAWAVQLPAGKDFYPRSPCGERPKCFLTIFAVTLFLSTLSVWRATLFGQSCKLTELNFYPRSPCGERQQYVLDAVRERIFLSTLSVWRATSKRPLFLFSYGNFYPRSPCGERQRRGPPRRQKRRDFYPRSPCGERRCYDER